MSAVDEGDPVLGVGGRAVGQVGGEVGPDLLGEALAGLGERRGERGAGPAARTRGRRAIGPIVS